MKKLFIFALFNVCLCAFSVGAQEYKTVADGVEYAEYVREIEKLPVRMNLLRVDLTKVRLDVVHALDQAIGTETTSSMAKRHGAIAAVNAGFFRLDRSIFAGDAAGVLQIDGKLLSETFGGRTALIIANDDAIIGTGAAITGANSALFGGNATLNHSKNRLTGGKANATRVAIANLESVTKLIVGTREFVGVGINRERKKDEIVVFTPEFNRTTLTDADGVEVVVRSGKIVEIRNGAGSCVIPADGFVVSASGAKKAELLAAAQLKNRVAFAAEVFAESVSGDSTGGKYAVRGEDITNGVPQLIKNGAIDITWEKEKSSQAFVETKHPRTAVAQLKDGKFLLMTVDGRSEKSAGIGLQHLAELLIEFGATDAMNLDGGGSTTMFLNGAIVNQPSDKEGERKVSDAVLVRPRRK